MLLSAVLTAGNETTRNTNVLFEELMPRFSEVKLVGSPVRDKQLLVNSWEDVRVAFSGGSL